jgi:uncharacterized repeat protein (TIGR01451 family)
MQNIFSVSHARTFRRIFAAAALILVLLNTGCLGLASASSPQPSSTAQALSRAPRYFTPNRGQTDPAVAFQARGSGGSLFFTPGEVVIVLPQGRDEIAAPLTLQDRIGDSAAVPGIPEGSTAQPAVVRLDFVGANPAAAISGANPLPGKENYFSGNDPSKWITGVPTYAGLVYQGIYPGIDLLYEAASPTGGRAGGEALKGTFVVAPGADPSLIRWRYQGADVRVDDGGNLRVTYPASAAVSSSAAGAPKIELVEQAPVTWQENAQGRSPVKARYSLAPDGSVSFDLPAGYDRGRALWLDPTLVYSTYLGDSGEDNGSGIAVDGSGIYVAGLTSSTSFPTAGTPYQGASGGGYDVVVTKFDLSGATLAYSTYLGGGGSDYGLGLAIDGSGDAYVTGLTDSSNFPTSAGAYDAACGNLVACPANVYDAFLTKLNPDGSSLLYSTYLGGDDLDIGFSVAVDGSGNAYLAGRADSTNFPTAGTPFQNASGGAPDAFVAKINPAASGAASLVYSTYLGGTGLERVNGLTIDSSGNAYLVGRTGSTNFPTAGTPYQSSLAGSVDAFVAKLDSAGSTLLYSTYLGGAGDDLGFTIARDPSNNVYVTGQTLSTDFPTTTGAFDRTCGSDGNCNFGRLDAFVVKIDPSASGPASLVYSTYFGGGSDDSGQGIAVDGSGSAYLTGYTDSQDMSTLNAMQPVCGWGCGNGFVDAFAVRFNTSGTGLVYSTFLGGSSSDYGIAVTLDASGVPYITGDIYSSDFPLASPYDSTWAGSYDTLVAKIDKSASSADLSVTQSATPDPALRQTAYTYTLTITNSGPDSAVGLRLIDTIPSTVSFVSATPSQGSCQLVALTAVSCNLGNLGSGLQATVAVVVVPPSTGVYHNAANAASNVSDPDGANNASNLDNTVTELLNFLPAIFKN